MLTDFQKELYFDHGFVPFSETELINFYNCNEIKKVVKVLKCEAVKGIIGNDRYSIKVASFENNLFKSYGVSYVDKSDIMSFVRTLQEESGLIIPIIDL